MTPLAEPRLSPEERARQRAMAAARRRRLALEHRPAWRPSGIALLLGLGLWTLVAWALL